MSQKKKTGKKQLLMTKAQINRMKTEAVDEAFTKAFLFLLLAAKDELGLGEKRLIRIIERADRYADHVEEKRIALKEVQEIFERTSHLTIK